MTPGNKTSEQKACYVAFFVGLGLALSGIASGADLAGLSALVVAVCSPLMWYAGNRSYLKARKGEK
jgi:hypothetical protein